MAVPLLDDLLALLCLARVVERGSFTQAAASLAISKSVVSQKIAALEARLGEPLLLRTTRRVTTTAEGARIYAYARQMVDAGTAATSGATDATRGVLRISAPVSFAQLHLAEPLAAFTARHPGTRVELLLEDRLVDLVGDRIDLAIRITKLEDSSLIARRLTSTALHVCAAPRYLTLRGRPERPEELLRHDCLRYALLRADHEWRFYAGRKRINLSLTGSFETTSGVMLRQAAIAGMGLAMLPRFMIADALAEGRLVTVLEEFAPRPLGIFAVRAGRRTPPKLVGELLSALEVAFASPRW
jgi:DNA-binding transcriptional LysR family regulator